MRHRPCYIISFGSGYIVADQQISHVKNERSGNQCGAIEQRDQSIGNQNGRKTMICKPAIIEYTQQ